MNTEAEIVAALRRNLEAGQRALAAGDMVTYRALAEQESRWMDELRAIWRSRAEES